MEDSNLYFKVDILSSQLDKTDYPSWKINDSLNIKENNFNDILLMNNEESFDENFDNYNYIKSNEENEEKILKDSSINKGENLLNSPNIESYDFKKINEIEIKKQLKLKRNREIARNSRLRKNQYMKNVICDFNKLKNKYLKLLNIIEKCPNCHNISIHLIKEEEEKKDKIINESKISNKKNFLFTTAITIISIINIFNIPLNIMNYYKIGENNKINYLRNLDNNYKQNYSIDGIQNILINKLNSSNGDNEALYIHFAEYYSIIKDAEKIIDIKNDLSNETDKNIRILKDKEININETSEEDVKKCPKCVVEIDKKSINLKGNEFTFYLADSKFFDNNNEDGIFPKFNFEENKKENFSKIIALKCKIIAYSINDLYSKKIDF